MTPGQKTTTLAHSPKAFEIDAAWYESYWYGGPQPEPASTGARFFQAVAWAAVFVAGAYFLI